MVLDRNPENFFAEVEQAGFNPSNLVPGTGLSPGPDADGRGSSATTTRTCTGSARTTSSCRSTAPQCPVHSYNKDGHDDLPPRRRPAGLRAELLRRPGGGPGARARTIGWDVEAGEIGRTAYEKHAEDDDFGQPGTLVREVMDDARARARSSPTSSATRPTTSPTPMQLRVIAYWTRVDEHDRRPRRGGAGPGQRRAPPRRDARRAGAGRRPGRDRVGSRADRRAAAGSRRGR